jgi:hypothetical protein
MSHFDSTRNCSGLLPYRLSQIDIRLQLRRQPQPCVDADFGSRTGQTTHQQTRMPEDAVIDRREGVFDGASARLSSLLA